MPALVDTNLLIHAMSGVAGHLTPESAMSWNILRQAGPVLISAISWMELHIHIRPLQRSLLGRMKSATYWRICDIDERVAERTSELLSLRAKDSEVCPVCLSVKRAAPCKACRRLLSRPQRFADAMIVATADCNPDIDVLYTFDAGVLDMGRLVTGCDIRNPMTVEAPVDAHP